MLKELILLQRVSLGLQCDQIIADEEADEYVKESAQFISDALAEGHMWAFEWHGYRFETIPEKIAEAVGNILTMWRVIGNSYQRLSEDDQKDVVNQTRARFREDGELKFPGFDGNEEASHLLVAMFLVEKMNRFQELNARDLNSHWPMLDEYWKMLSVFRSIKEHFGGLNKENLIRVLNADN